MEGVYLSLDFIMKIVEEVPIVENSLISFW